MDASIINFVAGDSGNWLVKIIMWLVQICGSVGIGVILFTLILKLVTLPFDVYSKIQMRKNSIKMEEMREDLEKLQKQYANDKELYNQKMMALYKKNGYSMWGACLPTIITLVIFIVAISAFNNYSTWQNRKYFADMTASYNRVVYDAFDVDGDYIKRNADGTLVFNNKKLYDATQPIDKPYNYEIKDGENNTLFTITVVNEDLGGGDNGTKDGIIDSFSVTTNNSYIRLHRGCKADGTAFYKSNYEILEEELPKSSLKASGKTYLDFETAKKTAIDTKIDADQTIVDKDAKKQEEYKKIPYQFILDIQQTKSAETFKNADASFLWIKNIWVSDTPTKHPIHPSATTFNQEYAASIKVTDYNNLVAKLGAQKEQANGYFILVALTIVSSFLMQFVTSKSQKAQMELQTVDGQGAQTNKVMMWMMPIMMAIFAFIYTAAFSLYIVISNLLSLGSTLLINYFVNKKYKSSTTTQVVRGRVHTPKQEEEKPKEKKSIFSSFAKKEEPENVFLSGKADKKKPRGRLK